MKSSDNHPAILNNHPIFLFNRAGKKIFLSLKKIVTNENSSVTVVSKMTLNNTRPASDSSAPRRVTYFGSMA